MTNQNKSSFRKKPFKRKVSKVCFVLLFVCYYLFLILTKSLCLSAPFNTLIISSLCDYFMCIK